MNIGVLGLGFMGGTHLQGMAHIPSASVVAVMDGNEKRLSGDLSDIQGNLGIGSVDMDFRRLARYADVASILADASVEAVDICLPTHLHAPVAIAALEAGKHVLVEKPMALDAASAQGMLDAAARAGRTLMVAHVLRFMAPYRGLVELVRSGRLGRVRSAVFRRRTAVPGWGPWEFDHSKSGGGVFDLLVHDVDMAIHLFGMPHSVSATGFENLAGGVDMIAASLEVEAADSVVITGGWHHAGEYPFSMEYTVVADEGVVEFRSPDRPATVYWKDGRTQVLPVSDYDPYAAEIAYFLECCSEGKQPEWCDPAESAAAVKVGALMSAARERRGEKVTVA
jgi:predicted dehydrogenase